MRIDLISFERQDLYVSFTDRFELLVGGKHYMIKEDFFKPKGNVLQNIRIMDPYLHELKFDTTVVNIPGLMSKGRKGISIKQILMDILNNHKSTVRNNAEMYYNHIEAILKFLEDFHEGKRQAKIMNLDDETKEAWQDVIGNL